MNTILFRIVEAVFTGVLEQFFYHLFFERDKDNIENIDNDNNETMDIEHRKR
jgi:hypothetical protein